MDSDQGVVVQNYYLTKSKRAAVIVSALIYSLIIIPVKLNRSNKCFNERNTLCITTMFVGIKIYIHIQLNRIMITHLIQLGNVTDEYKVAKRQLLSVSASKS